MCSTQIREYVNKLGLNQNDFIVRHHPWMINKELRKIGQKVLSPRQLEHKQLTLYDFRHSSACYWLIRYKSESALKYRFGWKKSDMIHYYTEFLGMKDTIKQEDMYVDITKSVLEKENEKLKKKINYIISDLKKLKEFLEKIPLVQEVK